MSDASVHTWFIQTVSDDVLGDEFNLETAPPDLRLIVCFGLCRAAMMLMAPCGSAPVSLCGLCRSDGAAPAIAVCLPLVFSRDLLILIRCSTSHDLVLADVSVRWLVVRILLCAFMACYAQPQVSH